MILDHAHRGQLLDRHRGVEALAGGLADQDVDLEVLGEPLDAGGEVHRVAHERVGEPLRAADVAGEHSAGVDADAVAQGGLAGGLAAGVPGAEPPAHVEGGPHRHRGVIARGDRRAEHRLDLVADELQYEAVLGADGLGHLGEVLVEVADDVARGGGLDPGGEVADVGEQDRDLLELAVAADPAGEDLVADLGGDVLAEGLLDQLALTQAVEHAVEALGHRADLVGADHRAVAIEVAPLDLGHGGLDILEGRCDTVGREEGQADRDDDADGHEEQHRRAQAGHDSPGGGRVGVEQVEPPRVRHDAEHRERDHRGEQEDGEQPDAHREAGHARHRAQVTFREEK